MYFTEPILHILQHFNSADIHGIEALVHYAVVYAGAVGAGRGAVLGQALRVVRRRSCHGVRPRGAGIGIPCRPPAGRKQQRRREGYGRRYQKTPVFHQEPLPAVTARP